MIYEFNFSVHPKPIQSVRFIKSTGFTYQPKENHEYKAHIRLQALAQRPANFQLITSLVRIKATFIFPYLKCFKKDKLERIYRDEIIYKGTRPDGDNLLKGLCDALNGTIWADDSLISVGTYIKIYGTSASIKLTVEDLGDE